MGQHIRARALLTRLASFAVAATLAATLGLAGQAGATQRSTVQIVLLRDANGREAGWSSTGAFTDAGTWTTDNINPDALGQAFEVTTTQTSAAGTFTVNFEAVFANQHNQRHWHVTSGTGAYSTLQAGGTWIVETTTDGGRKFTLDGTAHFD
jgi:hypothetical protein